MQFLFVCVVCKCFTYDFDNVFQCFGTQYDRGAGLQNLEIIVLDLKCYICSANACHMNHECFLGLGAP